MSATTPANTDSGQAPDPEPVGPATWADAGFSTRAIHCGQDPDPTTGAVVPPLHLSSTFKQDGVGGLRDGFEYSRSDNPTRRVLESALASLESGAQGGASARGGAEHSQPTAALAYASGLAAADSVFRAVLTPGDHIVIPDDAYGGTFRLVDRVVAAAGVEYSVAPTHDLDAVRAAIRPGKTKLVWIESPSNPLLGITDIRAVSTISHTAGALIAVDNTFATPYLQRPLALGADLVVHSTTKYLGGHSDVIGGAVIATDPELIERLAFLRNATGAVPGAFDCWLVLRGIKTLGVRMDRHCANAAAVAAALTELDQVTAVLYPGLPSHPGHETAASQMSGFGGMVSFLIAGGEEVARDVCAHTKIFTLAESLGGVESLIELPAAMTHASASESELAVPTNLIRLSVGIEDAVDLVADLKQAIG